MRKYSAIWDTGATGTVITERVAKECGLTPIGMSRVHTANGSYDAEEFYVNIALPNNVGVTFVRVTKTESLGNEDVLIGMDLITMGDFAVTNVGGKTMFSFRMPASEHIDFSKPKPPVSLVSGVGRNSLCPCGKGKKYKHCCGK